MGPLQLQHCQWAQPHMAKSGTDLMFLPARQTVYCFGSYSEPCSYHLPSLYFMNCVNVKIYGLHTAQGCVQKAKLNFPQLFPHGKQDILH